MATTPPTGQATRYPSHQACPPASSPSGAWYGPAGATALSAAGVAASALLLVWAGQDLGQPRTAADSASAPSEAWLLLAGAAGGMIVSAWWLAASVWVLVRLSRQRQEPCSVHATGPGRLRRQGGSAAGTDRFPGPPRLLRPAVLAVAGAAAVSAPTVAHSAPATESPAPVPVDAADEAVSPATSTPEASEPTAPSTSQGTAALDAVERGTMNQTTQEQSTVVESLSPLFGPSPAASSPEGSASADAPAPASTNSSWVAEAVQDISASPEASAPVLTPEEAEQVVAAARPATDAPSATASPDAGSGAAQTAPTGAALSAPLLSPLFAAGAAASSPEEVVGTGDSEATSLESQEAKGGVPAEHVVLRGESLWSIAAQLRGPQATGAQIEETVHRIHVTNRAVLGEDPDVVYAGTVLDLRGL